MELFSMVKMKLHVNFQSLIESGSAPSPWCLVSIPSFKEAKWTFLTPERGYMFFFFLEPV